jgi:hypothetical protein
MFNVCWAGSEEEGLAREVRSLTWADFERFGIDEQNRLYFDGKKVITEQTITFDWWVSLFVILGGFGAFVSGLIDLCKTTCVKRMLASVKTFTSCGKYLTKRNRRHYLLL